MVRVQSGPPPPESPPSGPRSTSTQSIPTAAAAAVTSTAAAGPASLDSKALMEETSSLRLAIAANNQTLREQMEVN